jgi:hypothetical protein
VFVLGDSNAQLSLIGRHRPPASAAGPYFFVAIFGGWSGDFDQIGPAFSVLLPPKKWKRNVGGGLPLFSFLFPAQESRGFFSFVCLLSPKLNHCQYL